MSSQDIFWQIFQDTGCIEAYLMYREIEGAAQALAEEESEE
ncbi:MAG: YqzL family protein [bacterium]